MNSDMKLAIAIALTLGSVVVPLICYNLYINSQAIEQKEKDREAYMDCLRLTEKLLTSDPKRISTPYCHN